MQALDLLERVVEVPVLNYGNRYSALRVALSPLGGCEKMVGRRR
tara:strand:- start:823 stop:954 length:132 start_codon:yes stop_codon:yes gene_type:complete